MPLRLGVSSVRVTLRPCMPRAAPSSRCSAPRPWPQAGRFRRRPRHPSGWSRRRSGCRSVPNRTAPRCPSTRASSGRRGPGRGRPSCSPTASAGARPTSPNGAGSWRPAATSCWATRPGASGPRAGASTWTTRHTRWPMRGPWSTCWPGAPTCGRTGRGTPGWGCSGPPTAEPWRSCSGRPIPGSTVSSEWSPGTTSRTPSSRNSRSPHGGRTRVRRGSPMPMRWPVRRRCHEPPSPGRSRRCGPPGSSERSRPEQPVRPVQPVRPARGRRRWQTCCAAGSTSRCAGSCWRPPGPGGPVPNCSPCCGRTAPSRCSAGCALRRCSSRG